ncbi:hypothetical protein DL769_003362 [Monosporascus sp. CRB-8-3]|nr:hypothetical protein DL769_003362 [Monosporascus sp. CRB-8-3]
MWHAPTELSGPRRAIYFPFYTVDNDFDFLQTLYEHREWVEKPVGPVYIGVVVAWEEVKSVIDDLLQDMGDGIEVNNVSEEDFVDKLQFKAASGDWLEIA